MMDYERIAKSVGLTLLLTTLVGTAVACVVVAPEVFFLTFLALLLAIFLAKTAALLNRWLPLGYSGNLALLVLLLCIATVGGGYYLATTIDQQIERATQQMDRSAARLEQWLRQRPYTRDVLAQVPFLDRLLDGTLTSSGSTQALTEEPEEPQEPADTQRSGYEESESDAESSDSPVTDDNAPNRGKVNSGEQLYDRAREASSTIISVLTSIFATTFGLVTSLLYIIFVGLFLAVDPKLYRRGLVSLFTPQSQTRVGNVLDQIGDQLYSWLGGRMLTMLITGLGTGVGLWLLGVPLAGSVGFITALLTFIPNVGAALAFLLAGLMGLSQGASTVIWVIGLYLLLQLIESNVLTPLIQQRQTSIPPALLLAFQLLLGMLTGFLGLMVATPLLAAGMVVVRETWQKRVNGVH